jgi:hypothetical protein
MVAVICFVYLPLQGCATWQPPPTFEGHAWRERAATQSTQNVTIKAAVLSADECIQLFGDDLNARGIQSVWVEVINRSAQPLWLLQSGSDPDYFSPLEVAWPLHQPLSRDANARIDGYFNSFAFENPVPPGAGRSGILFTNPQVTPKVFNVDLLGHRSLIPFTLFLRVPDAGEAQGYEQMVMRLNRAETVDYQDLDTFRAALESLPCCATSATGDSTGDPLNVVLVGRFEDIASAMVRRSYRRNVRDADFRQRLFGAPPHFVLRKSGQGGTPANWLRLWVAPLRFQGRPVLLAQAGRPVGGRFRDSAQPETDLHPDPDEARNLLIQDMMYSGGLDQLGFVGGGNQSVERAATTAHFHTDGVRAVLMLSARPLSLSEVTFLEWLPLLQQREADAAAQE